MRKLFFDQIRQQKFQKKVEAKQDRFAYGIGGKNGTYIEIGAFRPIAKNNTYTLETYHGWKGISLEINKKFEEQWKQSGRSNKIYWADAITFDYLTALKENNLPTRINYLQVDIEPPMNTFAALKRVIEQGIVCDCITFEHDQYAHVEPYDQMVTEYLQDHGYKIAISNVSVQRKRRPGEWAFFETWYVKDDIEFKTMDWFKWMETYVL
jgi:hypothetical protein